jgi:hypothetical protein
VPLVAALIAVPLPLSRPVTVVESVIAGVVVAVATVPASPLADTTDTLVTVPPASVVHVGAPAPPLVSTWPSVPATLTARAGPVP